jgi:hypothetical protein
MPCGGQARLAVLSYAGSPATEGTGRESLGVAELTMEKSHKYLSVLRF